MLRRKLSRRLFKRGGPRELNNVSQRHVWGSGVVGKASKQSTLLITNFLVWRCYKLFYVFIISVINNKDKLGVLIKSEFTGHFKSKSKSNCQAQVQVQVR